MKTIDNLTHEQLATLLRKHKGEIVGTIMTANDSLQVRLYKSDLLLQLRDHPKDLPSPFYVGIDSHGTLYLHAV